MTGLLGLGPTGHRVGLHAVGWMLVPGLRRFDLDRWDFYRLVLRAHLNLRPLNIVLGKLAAFRADVNFGQLAFLGLADLATSDSDADNSECENLDRIIHAIPFRRPRRRRGHRL